MVDVGDKAISARSATAEGYISMAQETLALINDQGHAKGDVLSVARIAGIRAAKRTAETEAEDAPEAKATKTSPVENTLETIADVQREYPSIVKVESKNLAIWCTKRSDESDSEEAVFLQGLEDTVVSPKTALGSIGAGLWLEGKKAKEMMEQMSCRLNRPRHTMRLRHNTQSFRCYKNIVALHVLLLRCQVVPVHVDQRSGYGRGVGGTAD